MPRILGIDYGQRRVGLAISDPLHVIAKPLLTLDRKTAPDWLARLDAILREHDVERVVVGHPRSLRGTATAQTRVVEAFIDRLRARLTLPVEQYDERLTTVAAKRSLISQGIKAGEAKGAVDRTAAALLLQAFLDAGGGKGD